MNSEQPWNTDEFERSAEQLEEGFLREFARFLRHNKKWWLVPILLVLATIGLLVVAVSGPSSMFIYTLF